MNILTTLLAMTAALVLLRALRRDRTGDGATLRAIEQWREGR